MIREALDRAKTTSPQLRATATSLGRFTPRPKETWALVTQLLEARAGREGSTVGCGDCAASERRRIVQATAAAIESLALAERCSWSELSRRSGCRVKVAAALA